MSDLQNHYRIRVRGRLDPSWSDRVGGLSITNLDDGDLETTTLVGTLSDQSALSGVLNTLVDLRLELLSVDQIDEPPVLEHRGEKP